MASSPTSTRSSSSAPTRSPASTAASPASPASTKFSASTAAYTYESSSFLVTQTFNLKPQTTPWVPPQGCSKSIFCSMKEGEVKAGTVCFEYNLIRSTTSQYLSSPCFPDDYKDIYYHDTQYKDLVTMAFPGDTCPRSWSPVCSQGVLSGSATVMQTWCCPPGYHTCDIVAGARNCMSFLTSTTEMWVIKDNGGASATSGGPSRQLITNKPIPNGQNITVYKAVFPLVGANAMVTGSAAGSVVNPGTTAPGGPNPGDDPGTDGGGGGGQTGGGSSGGGLSPGAIAGVVVGSVVGLAALALLGVLLFFFLRRRKRRGSEHMPVPQEGPLDTSNMYDQTQNAYYNKQAAPGSSGAYDPHASTTTAGVGGGDGSYYGPVKSELPAVLPAELDSQPMPPPSPAEMGSGTPAQPQQQQQHPHPFTSHPISPYSAGPPSQSGPGGPPLDHGAQQR